ncbi:MAG: malate dehydrogenase [Candidatus Omnitrophica bacterium]|nr:malate dehydrogenase [Candidatus Omnitrophota bacterium]
MSVKKISIVGAGQVGSTLAFLLLIRRLCSQITLVDVQHELAKACVLDLEDSRWVFSAITNLTSSNKLQSLASSDIIVITAGKPRSPGMSRADLIKANTSTIRDISRGIKKFAPEALVILITNPLDLMTCVALKTSGFSKGRVFGMGSSLDSARLANLISQRLKLNIKDINPVVFGAHGKDMLVSENTTVQAAGLANFLSKKDFSRLKEATLNRGASIVGLLKKGSARFGPAAACLDLIEAVVFDQKKITFASVYLNGQYSIKGVCLGVPVVVGREGIERILELKLSKQEKNILIQAARTIRGHLKLLRD